MSDQRTISGVLADLAHEFSPEQRVNVYRLDAKRRQAYLQYQGQYRVKDSPSIFGSASPTEFALEPLDAQGNVISVQQAFNNEMGRDD